jgi:hypothetical protein
MVAEMKSKPFTMLMIFSLYAGGMFMWQQQASFASEQEVQQISAQVRGVQQTGLENRLGAISAELFSLQQKVADMVSTHKEVDQIYYSRVNELLIEKAKVERQLANFK